MILAVDIGNTAIKLAVVDDVTVYDLIRSKQEDFISQVKSIQSNYPDLKNACICQVGAMDIKLLHALEGLLKVTYINQETSLPFFNKYQSVTLGNDRKALVAGALTSAPSGKEILVIDAGTCVTYDFIDADRNYWGGAISPGLHLRYQSLHNFTAQLPLLQPQKPETLIGNSTTESIHSGVVNGLALEIKGVIKKYSKKHPNLYVIITGGDAELLVKQLKNRFFASPFLMLYGIHNLYKLNS
ncbi:type III pantothenate kinase [Nonlabens marinus]|uniref:Type III pantothenate kinase n=1 Tax=Nonlabens marinus S1-08 TaxID=1454201 RepID=W8VZZ8_9FLAO|nr:type III pantothenate kinase [Nonlabens marinus]BAO55451.1 pantothenate kinase type III, CoaX-like [Nonlabens marinus S1-08]